MTPALAPVAYHRLFMRAALAAAHVFAWVIAFQYFFAVRGSVETALAAVALTYGLAHLITVLFTPIAARFLRNGARRLLTLATLVLAVAFFLFGAGLAGVLGDVGRGVTLFAVLFGVYRALYWVPYRVTAHARRTHVSMEILIALMPFFAGISLAWNESAPVLLFIAAGFLCLAALAPISRMEDTHEGFSLGFRTAFHELFASAHRRPLIRAVLGGFEGGVLLLLWPLIIFILLDWSYATLGVVMSLTLLSTMAARWLLGRFNVQLHRRPLVHVAVAASAWIVRGVTATPVAFILVDTYAHAAGSTSRRGIDVSTLEQSADSHTYMDELTALQEMGQGLGRVVFAVSLAALLALGFFPAAVILFTIAAVAAGASAYLSHRSG
jgi:hypothetical protein